MTELNDRPIVRPVSLRARYDHETRRILLDLDDDLPIVEMTAAQALHLIDGLALVLQSAIHDAGHE